MEINIHTVDKIVVSEKDYIDYFLTHNYNENMFNSDGTINKNYNSFKKLVLLQKFSMNIGMKHTKIIKT